MLSRYARLWVVCGILSALTAVRALRDAAPSGWVRPLGTRPGPVRILQFYPSVKALLAGQKAQLCYGVENARSVKISPALQGVYPSLRRCLEIVPTHTTHYTILAVGFDGTVAVKSFTLPVRTIPPPPRTLAYSASLRRQPIFPRGPTFLCPRPL
jgi:hypothetical protein